jgi:arsenite methyltransferase
MAELSETRAAVREKYAAAARANGGCGCGPGGFGAELYARESLDPGTGAAVAASLGCAVPTAIAGLQDGGTALDLGSGAGGDVLISAKRVGPTGRAIGLQAAGFDQLEIRTTHRVHEHAAAAIVRAREHAAAAIVRARKP